MSEEVLICPSCSTQFNDRKNSPLVLDCGHTFCQECLVNQKVSKKELRCPHCNKLELRNIDKLPKNFLICDVSFTPAPATSSSVESTTCNLHPNEEITYISQSTRQLYCSECLSNRRVNDPFQLDAHLIYSQLRIFREIYSQTNASDLDTRAMIVDSLSEALDGHKHRLLNSLDCAYNDAMQSLEQQYTNFKRNVSEILLKEKEKFNDCRELMIFLRDMKRINLSIDDISSKIPVARVIQAIGSFLTMDNLGCSNDLKKIMATSLEFTNKWQTPVSMLDVPLAICETPTHLIQGVGNKIDCMEKKLSRFGIPTNRWGIFDGRNQVDAVTFSVNQKIYLTALGIGNAFHPTKSVVIESLKILEGDATISPEKYSDGNISMYYDTNREKVVKVALKSPIEILPNTDYTIKIIMKGDAGVFRGGSTTRVKSTPTGLIFKFKNTHYTSEDVKNGENADDGPIFDLYYKMGFEIEVEDTRIGRFEGVEPIWNLTRDNQIETFSFSFNKPVSLTAFGVANVAQEGGVCTISSLKIINGNSTRGEVIYSFDEAVPLYSKPNGITKVLLNSLVKLNARNIYTVRMVIRGNAPLYRGKGFKGTVITQDDIELTCQEADISYNEDIEGRGHLEGPLVDIYYASTEKINIFALGEVPQNLSELAGGETQLSRFEDFEKHWHLNSENQVDSFTFTFSEDVLITALGLGNCSNTGFYNVVENIQFLSGNNTVGPIIFNSFPKICLFNRADSEPIVKVPLESPVKISGKLEYTIRIIMRGEGKSFKGKKFRGASVTQPDGITFTCGKSNMGGNDKRNGDNETGGPIFDFYYIPLQRNYSLDDFNQLLKRIFPKLKGNNRNELVIEPAIIQEEVIISRYSNTGASWHVNTDGKQVEAISFKVNRDIKLTAIGIGNAYEESKKCTARKIQIRQGKGTHGAVVYKHSSKVKMINTGEASKFVKVKLENELELRANVYYTLRVKYKAGCAVTRGTSVNPNPSNKGVSFTFEKASFEGVDVENGSHEIHGPLKDFYFKI